MASAYVDTSVLIHLYRKNLAAQEWFSLQTQQLSVSSITWMEFMDGVPSKVGQTLCLSILSQFELIRLTDADQDWAILQMELYRLSHGVHINDCLIASLFYRFNVPIYTHKFKA